MLVLPYRRRASAHQERHNEQHEEDEEEDLRDSDRSPGDAAEAEDRRNEGDDEECNGPREHVVVVSFLAQSIGPSRDAALVYVQ